MKKSAAATGKRAYNKKANVSNEVEAFDIDHNPPKFSLRPTHHETLVFRERLEKTIANWSIGSAIVLDAKKKNAALKYLRDNYSQDKWGASKILGNDEKIRVYRLDAGVNKRK